MTKEERRAQIESGRDVDVFHDDFIELRHHVPVGIGSDTLGAEFFEKSNDRVHCALEDLRVIACDHEIAADRLDDIALSAGVRLGNVDARGARSFWAQEHSAGSGALVR